MTAERFVFRNIHLTWKICIQVPEPHSARGILEVGLKLHMSVHHQLRQPTRSTPCLAVLMFLLSFAVFAWGLNYKLSLYNSQATTSAHEPAAKLLSNQERPATRVPAIPREVPSLFPISIVALLITSLPIGESFVSHTRSYVPSHTVGMGGPLFRRPPPCTPLYA